MIKSKILKRLKLVLEFLEKLYEKKTFKLTSCCRFNTNSKLKW